MISVKSSAETDVLHILGVTSEVYRYHGSDFVVLGSAKLSLEF